MGSRATFLTCLTRLTFQPSCSAISSSVGSRPSSSVSAIAVLRILAILSTRWTGRRMVLDWLAKARLIDCFIHHAA